jgi:spermidine/putrescine transport system permease protein
VNALGLILIALTILGAVIWELNRRRAAKRIAPAG